MKNRGLILISIGFLFIVMSFGMIYYNKYENKNAGIKSKEVYNKIEESVKQISNNIESTEMKVVNIDGYDYIGTIKIPSLNLELPIMSDWDYNKMKISPCRYYGSVFTNDLVVCAHSYNNLFRRLKELNIGDIVILTDMNNNEYYYEVKVTEVLSPRDVKEMIESEFDLTLYTCTTDSINRFTVRLNRVY